MGPNAIWVSSLVCFFSFILVCVSVSFLFLLPDRYIGLTITKPFTDWKTISSMIRNTETYNLTNNTNNILEVVFTDRNQTGRVIMLQKLLDVAACTSPTIMPWVTPANRTPACVCITSTYLDFLNATWKNSTNISMSVRDKYADQMTACLRFKSIWVTESCGGKCWIHPIWVAFHSNYVLFLLTWGFVVNYQHKFFGGYWVSLFSLAFYYYY